MELWGEVIFHIDCDSFYASVEIMENPSLRGKAVAVAGDPRKRSGIILAKSQKAKIAGVKTAQTIWQAQALCPDLIVLPANFKLYQLVSRRIRQILLEYSDLVEAYGLDLSIV